MILFHFVDDEILKVSGYNNGQLKKKDLYESINNELRVIIAFMPIDECVVLSPTFLFESEIALKLVKKNYNFVKNGFIRLYMKESSLQDVLEKKQITYKRVGNISKYKSAYFSKDKKQILKLNIPSIRKINSVGTTSLDMWIKRYNTKLINSEIDPNIYHELIKRVTLTEERSFLWESVNRQLANMKIPEIDRLELNIRNEMSMSYLNAFEKQGLIIPNNSFIVPNFLYDEKSQKTFNIFKYTRIAQICDIYDKIINISSNDMIKLKFNNDYERCVNVIRGYVNKNLILDEIISELKKLGIIKDLKKIFNQYENKNLLGVGKMYNNIALTEETRILDEEYNDVKIGIITALEKELVAMKAMMNNVVEKFFKGKGSGHRFFVGEIKSANNKIHRVALACCGMGNNQAAIRAMNMLNHFVNIESIIMTGIAGGIPFPQDVSKHVRLGDIVVSNGIIQYDYEKDSCGRIICRSEPPLPSAELIEAVSIIKIGQYENKFPWVKYIKKYSNKIGFIKPDNCNDILHDINGNIIPHPQDNERNENPKVFYSKIASANILLKNPKKRDNLMKKFDVSAVEMEASGIADATWNSSIGYLVIRGICDYCDTYKDDKWQEYAALVAAAYTRTLIETLPLL